MFVKDILCRAAHFPKFIQPNGTFDNELLLKFDPIDGTAHYAMSVASRFLCRSDDEVHKYGCRTAAQKNKRFVRVKNRDPEPLSEEVHYVGFYRIAYGDVVTLVMSHYNVRCFWKPEGGETSHFQIEFVPNGIPGTKNELRRDRRAAIFILAERMTGPVRHICERDLHLRDQLESISLPELH